MSVVRKYEFPSKQSAMAAIEALEVQPVVVHLGHLVVTPAVYNESEELVSEAVLSDSYSIDVMWAELPLLPLEEGSEEEPSEIWEEHLVWCEPLGIHQFANTEAMHEWTARCKELHPELFPEPSEEE